MENENRNFASAESTTNSGRESSTSPQPSGNNCQYNGWQMKLDVAEIMLIHENRTSLMRNVKREKSLSSLGYETGSDRRSDKMQTMTIADSNTSTLSSREHQDNQLNSNRMSSDDEDYGDLQKEFDTLMEENKKLKQQTQKKDILKRKISMLKKENESLKSAQEQPARETPKPDSSEPHHSPKESPSKEPGVFAKSFLLTSTLGGLYIEPIDSTNGVPPLGDPANSNSLSPTHYSSFISSSSPPNGFLCKPIDNKMMCTTETQTMPPYNPPPATVTSKTNVYHYSPRVKVATTEEDEEAHRFVQDFKARRIALKLTQSDIGEELNRKAGARYGQSYISRMESIQLSTAIVLRMKPLLEDLLDAKEEERRQMKQSMDFDEEEYQIDRKRKKRTNFTPEQSILLTKYFADQPRPSPQEIDDIARKIDVDRNSVKMWFNNKRQSEKFRANPLPGIGSINSVGTLNPYAGPYGSMSSSFLMSGLMSNMQMSPVTTSSLNNLKLDYNLSNKLPNTTLSLDNVNLATTQAPFVFNNKDLNHLYNAETAARLSNVVCNNLKKDSPTSKSITEPNIIANHGNPSFTLASQASSPFIFNKELSSLYQSSRNDDASQHKVTNDLAQIYKERVGEGNTGPFNLSGSPPSSNGNIHPIPTIKSISPPSNNPAFSISQSLINRTLSQAALSSQQDTNGGSQSGGGNGGALSISPKFNCTP